MLGTTTLETTTTGNNNGGNNFNNGFQRQNRQWNTRPNNGSIPANNNNKKFQYVDINQYNDSQNAPNNDGSCYDGNQDMTQNQQAIDNAPPIQFNAMLLDSYESTHNTQGEKPVGEKFSFSFSQELDIQHDEMFAFRNDNRNTYNLRNRKEPLIDGIPPGLQPTPPDLRASNNP